MSPLASLWAATLSTPVVIAILFLEWWVFWFTLGRNFTTTCKLTGVANGATFLLAAGLVRSGALGGPVADLAWTGMLTALLLVWFVNASLELYVIGKLMRRLRRDWRWNHYDRAAILGVNGLTPIAAWLVAA